MYFGQIKCVLWWRISDTLYSTSNNPDEQMQRRRAGAELTAAGTGSLDDIDLIIRFFTKNMPCYCTHFKQYLVIMRRRYKTTRKHRNKTHTMTIKHTRSASHTAGCYVYVCQNMAWPYIPGYYMCIYWERLIIYSRMLYAYILRHRLIT